MSSATANKIISLAFVLFVGACHFSGGFAPNAETPSHAWHATQPCFHEGCYNR